MNDPEETVVVALAIATAGQTGIAEVPAIVRTLMRLGLNLREALDAVLAAAANERIELRPEAGLSRFSKAELELCPRMRDGTALTTCRALD